MTIWASRVEQSLLIAEEVRSRTVLGRCLAVALEYLYLGATIKCDGDTGDGTVLCRGQAHCSGDLRAWAVCYGFRRR